MIHSLTCPNGHAWEVDAEDAPCPVCGSAAESLDEGGSSTWDSGIADELPPPPGAAAKPLLTEEPDKLPTLPGYEIASELGHGGMGVVYAARHLALSRRVALKVIRGFAGRDEVARFRAEAEAVARLQHPNIVQIYEVGEHAGLPYLALEFVDGGSLAAKLRRSPLASRAAAELVATLARAVEHAHLRGVVHRDLKPGNILLTGEGSPKIADFGLAKLADDPGRSRSGQIIGTPAYMAPEQAAGRGDLVGPPADVWALGAILYECLTTRPPFRGATSVETVHQVLHSEPTAPAHERPGIPRDLETICLKCLRKQPEARYRTAGDLADDLTRFLEGKPILARRTPWWERGLMWAKRRPAAAALILVMILATASLTGLGYRHYRATQDYNRELEARNTTITQKNIDLGAAHASTTRERDRAEHNLLAALDVIDKMMGELGLQQIAHIPHIDRTRAKILDDALKFCDRLVASQQGDPRLRLFQALTLQRSGTILTYLQRNQEAAERFNRAFALLQHIAPLDPSQVEEGSLRNLEARLHLGRGRLLLQTGELKRARAEFDEALKLAEDPGAKKKDPEVLYLMAVANANLATSAMDESNPKEATLYLGRALQSCEELTRDPAPALDPLAIQTYVLNAFGAACLELDEVERAKGYFERGIESARVLLAASPANIDYRKLFARCLANFGTTLRITGYLKRAAQPLSQALAIREQLARDHPEIGEFALELCWSYYQTGQLHLARDEARTAIEWFTKAIDGLGRDTRVLGIATAQRLLGNVYRNRGAARAKLQQNRDAVNDLEAALKYVSAKLRPVIQADIALLCLAMDETAQALTTIEKILGDPDLAPELRLIAARVLARASAIVKDGDRAESLARRAVEQLALAEKAGFFRDPAHRAALNGVPELKGLRARSDFKQFRARVGG